MIKITNDTSTLNGSLLEMKDQLIYELAQQGVTATYDSTTGLLGLIHKISEIDAEGIITLTTNKSTLSYADSETATLTATYSKGAGYSLEVYNAVTGTKIGDMTDNNDGTYSYTYSSTGNGNISMTAVQTNDESNSITIEDILLYAPTEQYKSGNNIHAKLHNTFSLDNSNDWELTYDLKTSNAFVILTPVSNAENVSTGNLTTYCGMGANSNGNKLCALGYAPVINDGEIWHTSGGSYGSGYHSLKITKVNKKYTFYYDGSEITNTTSNDFTNQTPLYLYMRLNGNVSGYVKNIKVKTI